MIICGFPGIGKSTLTSKYPEAFIDLDSGYFNKNPDGTHNPNFVADYIEEIRKQQIESGKHILVSTHHSVIEALRLNGFPFKVIVPALELSEEYMERYKARKSPPEFIQKIYDNWVPFIEPLLDGDNTIVLKSGEFLIDVVEFNEGFDPFSIKVRRMKDA